MVLYSLTLFFVAATIISVAASQASSETVIDPELPNTILIQQSSNATEKNCVWPEPPAHGYNFRACGRYSCPEPPGTSVPHGTTMTTVCKKKYVQIQGERESYCENGSWTIQNFKCIECGRSPVHGGSLLHHGEDAKLGNFPWMAGIYLKNVTTNLWTIICGGTLISNHIVLTAAHCVKLKFNRTSATFISASDLKVGVGKLKTDLYIKEDTAFIANVRDMVFPDRYKGLTLNFALDIALLDLEDPLKTSDNIMPACVDWDGILPLVNRETGYLAGYGRTEEGEVSDRLQWAPQKYEDYLTCLSNLSRTNIQRIVHDKFCIRSIKGERAAKGDSGGGLTFVRDDVHFVYGVVSNRITIYDEDVTLFTSVSDHQDWITSHWKRLLKWRVQHAESDTRAFVGDVCKQVGEDLWQCRLQSSCIKEKGALNVLNNRGCYQDDGDNVPKDPVVCCEPKDKSPLKSSPSKTKCEEYESSYGKEVQTCKPFKTALEPRVWSSYNEVTEFAFVAIVSSNNFKDWSFAVQVSDHFLLTDAVTSAELKKNNTYLRKALLGVERPELHILAMQGDIVEEITHPEFTIVSPQHHNIALLRLKQAVAFSRTVRPICLHNKHLFPGTHVVTFGFVNHEALLKENTTTVGRKQCDTDNKHFDKTLVCLKIDNGVNVEFRPGMPLVVKPEDHPCMYTLVGMFNFDLTKTNPNLRAYTRISYYIPWIESIVWP